MNPEETENPCPHPDNGNMDISFATEINLLTSAAAEVEAKNAKGLAVHLAPFGTSTPPADTLLEIILTFADGSQTVLAPNPAGEALKNRLDDFSNGNYLASTIRAELPAEFASKTLVRVELKSSAKVGVLGVDIF